MGEVSCNIVKLFLLLVRNVKQMKMLSIPGAGLIKDDDVTTGQTCSAAATRGKYL